MDTLSNPEFIPKKDPYFVWDTYTNRAPKIGTLAQCERFAERDENRYRVLPNN